jgi:tetratricopeptide (TPR) repeat protein
MAQRVNKRFLVILTLVVAAFALLGLLSSLFLHRAPKNYAAAGDAAAQSGNWEAAVGDYARAVSLGHGDPDLYIRFGVALEHRVGADRDNFKQAEAAYENALVVDPGNLSAAHHLLDMFVQLAEVEPGPSVYSKLRDYAAKVVQLDPSDLKAAAYQHAAVIMLNDAGPGSAGRVLADDFDVLQKFVSKNPSESNLAHYYASGKLRLAAKMQKNGDPDGAARIAQDAGALFDAALAAKGDDAALNWRAANLYSQLPAFDPSGAATYQAKADAAMDRAKTLVKPADPHYADIQVAAATAAVKNQKPDEAQAILRALFETEPKNPVAQLRLGDFLGLLPGKRDEAIAILTPPITGNDEIGAPALLARPQEEDRLYLLARLRLESYPTIKDDTARKHLLDQIDDNYNSLAALIGNRESYALLYLKAQIQQIKGSAVDAMATYHQALAVMEHADHPDPDLMYHAGMLAALEGQTGESEKLFVRVVALNPTFVAPQLALADQYLEENSPDKAQAYIDSAQKLDPSLGLVWQLRVRQLVEQRQLDAARTAYTKLPEKDSSQQLEKARCALLVGETADAIRLLEPLQKQSPDNPTIATALVKAYVAGDQKDRASAIVDQGLAAKPNAVWLLLLRQQLQNPTGTSTDLLDPKLLGATNEFTRELLGYETELRRGDYSAAEVHLAAADKLKPDNKAVHELYFQFDLNRRRYDLAEQEIPKLAALHADGANGLMYRVQLALARGDTAAAVQAARDLVSLRPYFSQSYATLGATLAASGQPDKAVTEFQEALDRQHNNFDAWQGLIDAYLTLQQSDRAGQAILDARKLFPNSVSLREKAIEYDLAYSDHPEVAVAERQHLLDAGPDDPRNYVSLAQAALSVAERQQTTNPDASHQYVDQASGVLTKAFARWPHDVAVVGLLAQIDQYRGDPATAEKLLKDLAALPDLAARPEPSLLLADFYRRAGKSDAAIKSLYNAFEKSGHSVGVELKLGMALAHAGRYDEVLSLFHDQNGSDPRITRQRLEYLAATGRTNEAESEINEALRASPQSIALLNLLTTTYINAGRLGDARQAAKNAIAASGTDNDALYFQALIELKLSDGDMDLAMRDASQLKAKNPASPVAYGLLADVYSHQHLPDDAIRTLEEGLKAAPQDRALRLRLLDAYTLATPPLWPQFDSAVHDAEIDPLMGRDTVWLVKDAYGLAARKQFDAAIGKIDDAIHAAPDNNALISEKLTVLMLAQNYPAVIQTADALLAQGARPWWAYMARGIAKAQSDKPAGLLDLDAALAGAPDFAACARVISAMETNVGFDDAVSRAQKRDGDPNWRLMVADLDMQKGDLTAAATEAAPLRGNTQISPAQRLHALSTLSECYTMMHRPEDAKNAYLEALTIDPNETGMLNNLANLLADDLHDPQQALGYSQRAYDLSRRSGNFLASVGDTQGWVLTLCGGANAEAGLNILQKVVEDNQNFIDARYHLGEAYLRNSMPGDAVKQLEIAQTKLQQAEENHGRVSADLKTAIAASLSKARQVLDGKADAGGK